MSKLTPIAGLTLAKTIIVEAHADQFYGERPYTYHLHQVCDYVSLVNSPKAIMQVCELTGWSEDYNYEGVLQVLQTIALLHDLLEDTKWTEDDLYNKGYNDLVVDTVVSLTKQAGEDKEEYLQRLCKNPWAILVKKADSFANLQNCLSEGRTSGVYKYTENLAILGGLKIDPDTGISL